MTWILALVALWVALAVLAAVIIGRSVTLADDRAHLEDGVAPPAGDPTVRGGAQPGLPGSAQAPVPPAAPGPAPDAAAPPPPRERRRQQRAVRAPTRPPRP